MRRIAAALIAASLALPVQAQTQDAPDSEIGEGVDLLGEGARKLFRGLRDEMEPALRDLARDLRELNWNGIRIEDLDDYEPPEVLPNGDILLRRKPDLPPPDDSEIEL